MNADQGTTRARRMLWLFLIILLGLGLRLTGLRWGQGYAHFGAWDSLEAYAFAVDYAHGDTRAQYLGQPNFNPGAKLPGPLWSIFCLGGIRLGGSIEGVIMAIILLSTGTIYLTFLLAERTVGPCYSLWAALFAATLPFPVYYSVFVFNPNVMPFLGALLFLALWQVTQRDHSRAIFWVGFLPLLMPQFHLSVLSLLPAIGIILTISSRRLNIGLLACGAAAGLLLYVPYLRGEMSNGWQNTLAMSSGRGGHWWGGLKALIAPLNILANVVPQWTRSRSFLEYRELGNFCFGWFGVLLALNAIAVALALLLIGRSARDIIGAMRGFWQSSRATFRGSPGIVFLALVTVLPLLFTTISRQSFHVRYAIVLLAPLLALAGHATGQWISSPTVGRFFLIAITVSTCGNLWFIPSLYRYQARRIDQGTVFLGSFRNLERVYQSLKLHAGAGRSVQVDDATYLKGLVRDDRTYRDAELIRPYVATREKETSTLWISHPARPVVYAIHWSDRVTNDLADVAYVGHGIALVMKRLP